MAYTAPTVTDRIAVGDNKYTMTQLPDGRVMLTPAPDSVTEPGTDINKGLLQPALDAIAKHDAAKWIIEKITQSGTWTCPAEVTKIDAILVGGGQAGQQGDPASARWVSSSSAASISASYGGFGGEVIYVFGYTVIPGTAYPISIGAGGTTSGADGGATTAFGQTARGGSRANAIGAASILTSRGESSWANGRYPTISLFDGSYLAPAGGASGFQGGGNSGAAGTRGADGVEDADENGKTGTDGANGSGGGAGGNGVFVTHTSQTSANGGNGGKGGDSLIIGGGGGAGGSGGQPKQKHSGQIFQYEYYGYTGVGGAFGKGCNGGVFIRYYK